MKHWNKIALVVTLCVGGLLFKYGSLESMSATNAGSDMRNFLGLLAQLSATMLGFLLAALSILASISGQRIVRNMIKTGHYRVLLRCFFYNTIAFFVATALAIAAYLASSALFSFALAALLAFFFASLLLVDLGWRFWLVLSFLGVSEKTATEN